MARAPVIQQSLYPYSITGRCINKDWFSLPMDLVWEIMEEQLFYVAKSFNAEIHSFVLMSNHFHLLLSTPDANISQIMHHFMGTTSKCLTSAGNRVNQTYGGRYYRSMIISDCHYRNVYKYFYMNPVKAGLVDKVQDYKWSTLHGLLGRSKLVIPVVEDSLLFDDLEWALKWLNERPEVDDIEAMKKALKKKIFKLSKDKKTKKPHALNTNLL